VCGVCLGVGSFVGLWGEGKVSPFVLSAVCSIRRLLCFHLAMDQTRSFDSRSLQDRVFGLCLRNRRKPGQAKLAGSMEGSRYIYRIQDTGYLLDSVEAPASCSTSNVQVGMAIGLTMLLDAGDWVPVTGCW